MDSVDLAAIWQLKQLNNWVCWAYEEKDGKKTKVPKNPNTGGNAQSDNPSTWGSYALAEAAQSTFNFDGLGIMLDPAQINLVGIDLDRCIENGQIIDWAIDIVKALDSYTEVSPSGTGLRIFILGTLPPTGRRKGQIEMYTSGRFLTITKNHLKDTPEIIHDRSKEILALHQSIFNQPQPQQQQPPPTLGQLDDAELIGRILNAANGDKFKRLWLGDFTGYPSQSEGDLALCEILHFYTQGDKLQVDRLFRQSGLYRPKWDKRHAADGRTYGQTILDSVFNQYRDPNFYKQNGTIPPPANGTTATNSAAPQQQKSLFDTLTKLLEDAIDAEGLERVEKTKIFLEALAKADDVTIAYFTNEVKRLGLMTKGELKSELRKLQKVNTPTHDVLRDRWLATQMLTAYGMGEWRRYQNGVWPAVPEFIIKNEIQTIIERAKPEGIDPTNSLLTSVSELAKVKLSVSDDIWDAETDYLVCQNGTFQISTRTLLSHSPKYYAISGVSYDYDPQAVCPNWDVYIGDLKNNFGKETIDFLQEFAGYALTTDTKYEIGLWLYGPRGSGKSTFIEGLKAMLGDRVGLLGLADIERSRFALADLPGKTLVISTEQPAQYVTTTDIINRIISGEPIKVEQKFKDAYEIRPRCKPLWAMNDLPRINSPEDGIFRRVKIVQFPPLPPQCRDPLLKIGIMLEGAGIFNWSLVGLERLQKRGKFEVPAIIEATTEEFREKNDIPAAFVKEMCVTGLDTTHTPYSIKSSELYAAYREWCFLNGNKPSSSTSIAEDWKRLGFEKFISGGLVKWRFVALKI